MKVDIPLNKETKLKSELLVIVVIKSKLLLQ